MYTSLKKSHSEWLLLFKWLLTRTEQEAALTSDYMFPLIHLFNVLLYNLSLFLIWTFHKRINKFFQISKISIVHWINSSERPCHLMDDRKIAASFFLFRSDSHVHAKSSGTHNLSVGFVAVLSHNSRVTVICSRIVEQDEWSKGVIMYSLWNWVGATMGLTPRCQWMQLGYHSWCDVGHFTWSGWMFTLYIVVVFFLEFLDLGKE